MDTRQATSTVKRAVITAAVRQFGQPRGAAGKVAGWVMAHRSSNRRRNKWVVSLLDVRSTDRVLEIGFGPGLAIAELSRRIGESGHELEGLLRDAGFTQMRTEALDLDPPAVCVLGVAPAPDGEEANLS